MVGASGFMSTLLADGGWALVTEDNTREGLVAMGGLLVCLFDIVYSPVEWELRLDQIRKVVVKGQGVCVESLTTNRSTSCNIDKI